MSKAVSTWSLEKANRFILGKQHLTENTKIDNIVQIVRDIGGLHATNTTTPYLSLLARTFSFAKENLQEELYQKKSLAKVTYVRKTMFILPEDMLSIAFAAVKRNAERMTDQHLQYLKITQQDYNRVADRILEILKNGPLTLNELKSEMRPVPHLVYIVRLMCFQGLLIRGAPKAGWKNSQHTYVPFQEYYPDVDRMFHDEKEAQRFVIKDYITHYGPVTENDIFWWTGFPKSLVRGLVKDMRDELSTVDISGLEGPFLVLSTQACTQKDPQTPISPPINILPCLDPYLMGYKNRDRYLDQNFYGYVFDRSGNATTIILYEGRVVGIWDFEAPKFKYFLFFDIGSEAIDSLTTQAEKIGRFISGKGIQLKKCVSMKPLSIRTAGGVMSPLKDS